MALHFLEQALVDRAFRPAGCRIEDVGAVTHQRKNALVPDFGQFFCRGWFTDYRILVQLPVARVEDAAVRGFDQQRVALGNRVRKRKVGNPEWTDFEAAMIFVDDMQLDLVDQPCFLQLAPDQLGREGSCVDRHIQLGREIRHCADMILVTVRQHDSLELVDAILDEFQIGEYEIDPGVLIARKRHAQIDHQPASLAAVEIDIHANLARSPQGKEKQFVFGGEIFLQAARSARMARPSSVRSASTTSNRSVCSSNRIARPPVATTFAGRPISFFMRAINPSMRAT